MKERLFTFHCALTDDTRFAFVLLGVDINFQHLIKPGFSFVKLLFSPLY